MTNDHRATPAWPASAKPHSPLQPSGSDGDSAGRNRGVQPGNAVKQRTPLA
jgi:putative spermidine/putrescine transport system permease protein